MNFQQFYEQDVAPYFSPEQVEALLRAEVRIARFRSGYIEPHLKNSRKKQFNTRYKALGKVIEHLQGVGWFKHANFGKEHSVLSHLLKIVLKSSKHSYSKDDVKSIMDHADGMFGFWSGITRDEIRERPYYHHLLLAAMMGILIGLPTKYICALLRHDDLEDRSKHHNKRYENLGVKYSRADAERRLKQVMAPEVFDIVKSLTNPEKFGDQTKQEWQREHIKNLELFVAMCKCLDRIANVADFGERKKADRENVFEYLVNAAKLLEAALDDSEESQLVWMFFAQGAEFLHDKYLKPMI